MSVLTPPAPSAAATAAVRARELALGSPRAPRWARPALWAVLALAAGLALWNVSSIGNANSFYAASVLSGTQSWKALFFGSLDAGNFITVDKPPLAEWVMGLFCRVFGFGTWQMMLPVAAAGTASVALLYTMVRRSFGYVAATIAALVLALTPITVAINRDNNPDPFLVLLMLLGAAGCLRAIRTGRLAPLVWCGVAVGFAFDAKMLQGYMCLPAFFLAYGFAAKTGIWKRVRNLAVAGVALAASTGWFVVVADFMVSRDSRPYIGGSTDNTVWNLVIGYNGLGRVFGASAGVGSAGNGASFGGAAGAGRLFNSIMGGQISWLIPFATIALLAGLILRGRRPRHDMQRASYLLWGGWFGVHYVIFSFAEGTFHPYYTTAMAPGIAALTGAGGVAMYRAFRRDLKWVWVLPAAIAASAVWAYVLLSRTTSWNAWLGPVVAVVAALSVIGLLLSRFAPKLPSPRRLGAAAAGAGLIALLAGPAAYAFDTATGGSVNGTNPTAGPSTGGGMGGGGFGGGGGGGRNGGMGGPGGQQPGGQQGGQPSGQTSSQAPGGQQGGAPSGGGAPTGGGGGGMGGGGMGGASSELASYLLKHQDGATWILAVSNDQSAAQLILQTKKPVASMGGWSGSDNAMTLDKLKKLVKAGKLHYVQTGSSGGGPGGGGNSEVTAWVQKHGTALKIDSSVYRLDPSDV